MQKHKCHVKVSEVEKKSVVEGVVLTVFFQQCCFSNIRSVVLFCQGRPVHKTTAT